MSSDTGRIAKAMFLHYAAKYISVVFIVINVVFVLGVTFGIPLGDEWRWMKVLLIPLQRGDISFSEYLLGDYSFLAHSHYMALLFLYFDYAWLDLNFNYFTYIGLFFYVLGYLAILIYIRQFFQKNQAVNLSAIIVAAVGYFCITSDFPWLLVMFEYLYFFIALVTLLILDAYLLGRVRFAVLVSVCVICLLLADTIGMSAVFLSAAALLLAAIIFPHQRKYFLLFILIIGGLFFVQYVLFGKGHAPGHHSRLDTLLAIMRHPFDAVASFISIFSQPLIDITIFRTFVGQQYASALQLVLGIAGFIFVAVVLYFYAKSHGWKKSILPLLFIGYGCLNWALILISRYLDFGVDTMSEPRYVRLFTLIYVGAGIALLCIQYTRLMRRLIYCSAIGFLLVYGTTVSYKFWQDQYIESYFAGARVELLKDKLDSAGLANYIGRCAQNYCHEPIKFMKEKRLSIYAAPENH